MATGKSASLLKVVLPAAAEARSPPGGMVIPSKTPNTPCSALATNASSFRFGCSSLGTLSALIRKRPSLDSRSFGFGPCSMGISFLWCVRLDFPAPLFTFEMIRGIPPIESGRIRDPPRAGHSGSVPHQRKHYKDLFEVFSRSRFEACGSGCYLSFRTLTRAFATFATDMFFGAASPFRTN